LPKKVPYVSARLDGLWIKTGERHLPNGHHRIALTGVTGLTSSNVGAQQKAAITQGDGR
jgi:hypothetical protein